MSIVAIDIGGTFTDLASLDPATGKLTFAKSLTTPPQFEQGAIDCIDQAKIDPVSIQVLRHGTTVVINALLERKGAKTALVTTKGFRDILEIGRGNRPESFNLLYHRLPPFVPRDLRFEIDERMNAQGHALRPLDTGALAPLAQSLTDLGVQAVSICLLHAWRNPAHEILIANYLREHTSCYVTASHEISREFREFERTSTSVMNAYVGPSVAQYLERFGGGLRDKGFEGRLFLMGSNGGVLTEEDTRERPLLLLESGPVGGAAGAAEIGLRMGEKNLVAFDMGGTTAKAVFIEDSEAAVSPLYWVGGYDRGYPVQAAVLDIVEVGTGGGSIASVNELGSLEVGPKSAGALPGPACYARGGALPTVTDANLYLGRLDPNRFLGGTMPLNTALATQALEQLSISLSQPTLAIASGIIRISTLSMANAVRKVTIERGYDPRDFSMVAFGGAGPLHAVEVAREIGMRRVVIPPKPGHFSAYGMLYADFRYDLSETVARTLDSINMVEMSKSFERLESEGSKRLDKLGTPIESIRFSRYAEMRYQQQEYTLRVKLTPECNTTTQLRQLFEENYQRRYGHATKNMGVDVVMLRVVVDGRAIRPSEQAHATNNPLAAAPSHRPVWFESTGIVQCQVWQRDQIRPGHTINGPAVIEEDASTTVITLGDVAQVDASGNIVINLGAQA